MENNALFDQLLNKYLLETITEEETRQFFELLNDPSCQTLLKAYIGKDLEEEVFGNRHDPLITERIKQRLAKRIEDEQGDHRRETVTHRKHARLVLYRRSAAAAAAILVISIGIGVWIKNGRPGPPLAGKQQTVKVNDVPPGKEGAILTLADGTTVDLDSTGNGKVSQQGQTKIMKTGGLLSYKGSDNKQTEMLYNTITVPPAHQLQLSLADGSKVWLNASSSLRFPTSFTGRERIVELTGEGYFEIAHKNGQPFAVKVAGVEVQDIGTQFNIMAYPNEPAIRTTLVEGAAKVISGGRSALLRPSDQANITKESIEVRQDADMEEAIAWKNGLFLVKGADLAYVLRQVARWYDVEIVYEHGIPKGHMIADIPRTMNLSSVMELLRQFGISCKLEGKQLIIAG